MTDLLDREVLRALAGARAYPEDASAAGGVEWVQTHLSHVFLTPQRVYKFRKAVDLGFVCFTERAERNADCLREVALNRRLAPDVYLGVAPLCLEPVRVGPISEQLSDPDAEHCVVMRRLAARRDALSLLQEDRLAPDHLDRVAAIVASFHGSYGLGRPAPFEPEAWLERCTGPAEDNYRLLAEGDADLVPPALLARARERSRVFAAERAESFERRRRSGRAVDGHGDLHLQHLWFERDDADPLIVDCLEFSERLRHIDAAADVAFLAMDLRYRQRAELGERFLRRYARDSDDFDLYSVVDYFESYRAAVRAKVAAVAAADEGMERSQRRRAAESVRRHLELADASLEAPGRGALVLVGGVVGTGKSTVAEALADETRGVVASSDRVRKRMAGLAPSDRAGAAPGAGIYASEFTERVYRGLLERARPVVRSGRVAILDATFARRDHRARAAALARELDAGALFVETRCPSALARDRLARRRSQGGDPSDAGPELYAASAEGFEAVAPDEGLRHAVLETDRPSWREALRELVRGALPAPDPGGSPAR